MTLILSDNVNKLFLNYFLNGLEIGTKTAACYNIVLRPVYKKRVVVYSFCSGVQTRLYFQIHMPGKESFSTNVHVH